MKTPKISIEKAYKVLGFNDDQCTCDVCGKEELKGTYALEDMQTGDIIRAGSTCGARMANWTVKELNTKLRESEINNRKAAKEELNSSEEYKAYTAYIGSQQHEKDCENGFSGIDKSKIEPYHNKVAEIQIKYNVRFLS